jgi:hypothetical protein
MCGRKALSGASLDRVARICKVQKYWNEEKHGLGTGGPDGVGRTPSHSGYFPAIHDAQTRVMTCETRAWNAALRLCLDAQRTFAKDAATG